MSKRRVYRVLRGGSYFSNLTWNLRTADCVGYVPEDRGRDGGFRLVVRRRRKP